MILARVSFMSAALESNSLTLEWLYSEVSSAYWTLDGGVTSCRSDTYKLKIIGPRMDPLWDAILRQLVRGLPIVDLHELRAAR